jgi:hypothetical protein
LLVSALANQRRWCRRSSRFRPKPDRVFRKPELPTSSRRWRRLAGRACTLAAGTEEPLSLAEAWLAADTSPGPTSFTRSDAIGFLRKRRAHRGELGSEEPRSRSTYTSDPPTNRIAGRGRRALHRSARSPLLRKALRPKPVNVATIWGWGPTNRTEPQVPRQGGGGCSGHRRSGASYRCSRRSSRAVDVSRFRRSVAGRTRWRTNSRHPPAFAWERTP